MVDEPAVIPSAIEEFLRAYPLVMEGRRLSQDIDFHGVSMRAGEMVMLALPAIMHDPDQFERPDEVIIDRAKNNHLSFGGGPHRCLGSHLAADGDGRRPRGVAPEDPRLPAGLSGR